MKTIQNSPAGHHQPFESAPVLVNFFKGGPLTLPVQENATQFGAGFKLPRSFSEACIYRVRTTALPLESMGKTRSSIANLTAEVCALRDFHLEWRKDFIREYINKKDDSDSHKDVKKGMFGPKKARKTIPSHRRYQWWKK